LERRKQEDGRKKAVSFYGFPSSVFRLPSFFSAPIEALERLAREGGRGARELLHGRLVRLFRVIDLVQGLVDLAELVIRVRQSRTLRLRVIVNHFEERLARFGPLPLGE